MTTTIVHKKSSVSGKTPLTSQLQFGELAVNTYDGVVYFKKDPGTGEVVVALKQVTEDNLAIDSSGLDNSAGVVLSQVLQDLDTQITTNRNSTDAVALNGATLDDIVALSLALG